MNGPRANSPYRLTVEGTDDQHTVIHLLSRHNYPWDDASVKRPYVQVAGSWNQVLDSIPVAAKTYERAGVILDVDSDFASRWSATSKRLREVGYNVPDAPPPHGLVVESHASARFGVWLMPDNREPGRLEDFLQRLIDESDPTWPIANDSTSKAIEAGAGLRRGDHIKGALHAWLAWCDPPGMPFGTAIKARQLGHDGITASAFVAWFLRLFG